MKSEFILMNKQELIDKDGVMFHPKSTEPYTGTVYENMYDKKWIEGSYRNGKVDGLWTVWYDNGQKQSITSYEEGIKEGLSTSWYTNGQKSKEGKFREGREYGIWTEWYENGQMWGEVFF